MNISVKPNFFIKIYKIWQFVLYKKPRINNFVNIFSLDIIHNSKKKGYLHRHFVKTKAYLMKIVKISQ